MSNWKNILNAHHVKAQALQKNVQSVKGKVKLNVANVVIKEIVMIAMAQGRQKRKDVVIVMG